MENNNELEIKLDKLEKNYNDLERNYRALKYKHHNLNNRVDIYFSIGLSYIIYNIAKKL
jgi:hypothetical protein